jgi:hypothetical protein
MHDKAPENLLKAPVLGRHHLFQDLELDCSFDLDRAAPSTGRGQCVSALSQSGKTNARCNQPTKLD